jgi:hypothetical protein
MGALVDQRPQLRVRRHVGIDDDPLEPGIAPPACRALDRLERHRVRAIRRTLSGIDEMRVRIAGQRLLQRLQRHRRSPVKNLGL